MQLPVYNDDVARALMILWHKLAACFNGEWPFDRFDRLNGALLLITSTWYLLWPGSYLLLGTGDDVAVQSFVNRIVTGSCRRTDWGDAGGVLTQIVSSPCLAYALVQNRELFLYLFL